MVNSRTDTRLDGLEKATDEFKARLQQSDERAIALNAEIDALVAEIRAGFAAINNRSGRLTSQAAGGVLLEGTLPTPAAPPTPATPPTTVKEITLHASQQPLLTQQPCTPVAVQPPIPPPVLVPLPPSPATPPTPTTPLTPATLPSHIRLPTPAMVTAPLLSSSPFILQFHPSLLPRSKHFDPAAAADHAKLMVSSGPPTTTMVSAPRVSSSPNIQLQPPVQKHEWEPPPNKVIGLNFERNLEGKVVLRVRQLIRMGEWEIGKWFGQEWVSKLVPEKMADRWLTWSTMQANRWRKRGKQAQGFEEV